VRNIEHPTPKAFARHGGQAEQVKGFLQKATELTKRSRIPDLDARVRHRTDSPWRAPNRFTEGNEENEDTEINTTLLPSLPSV